MFTAIDLKTGEQVDSEEWEKREDVELRDPIFGKEVIYKPQHERASKYGSCLVRPHFASAPKEVIKEPPREIIFDPEYIKQSKNGTYSISESTDHIIGKTRLAEWAKENLIEGNEKIKFEHQVKIPQKGDKYRIIDVAIINEEVTIIAIECQISPISEESLIERIEDYQSVGIDSLWVFGDKAFREEFREVCYQYGGFACHTFTTE